MVMIRRLFLFLLGVALFLIIGGFLLPKGVSSEREIVINRSPDAVFSVLQDFRHFPEWSPWLVNRPDVEYRVSDPSAGPGARLVWSGADTDAADGQLNIVAADHSQRVEMELELQDRYRMDSWFELSPDPGGTRVVWAMTMEFGTFDLVGRYLGLMLPGLVGRDYQLGLESLKGYLESDGQTENGPGADS